MMRYLVCICFLVACSKNKLPDGVLKPQKMQVVFWDIIRADVLANDYLAKDSGRSPLKENLALQKKIFAHYGISRKDFYKSLDYYSTHPEIMNPVLDSMITIQNREKTRSQQKGINAYE